MKDFLATYALELVLLLCTSFLLWVGFRSKRDFVKHLFFNLSAVIVAVLIFELVLTIRNRPKTTIDYSREYVIADSELGYGVSDSSFSVKAKKQWVNSGEQIYSVTYSFADGRRVTPNADSLSQKYSVFLGGSFAFGEGLNDTETLPYYYNQHYSQKRNVRNYGFQGYGTHQVYTIARNHLATDSTLHAAENVEIFYWFTDPHILRANGYSQWDQNSASYAVENGVLKYRGTFKEAINGRSFMAKAYRFIWTNSGLFNRIKARLATSEEGIELVLRLIKETHELLKKRGFEFTVLVQNTSGSDPLFGKHFKDIRKRLVQALEEQGISFIYINEAILKKESDSHLFEIPGDKHPTAEFNRRLADLIWKKSNTTFNNR
ncbi:MAG: hypothetical protein JJ978_14005 [Roseivirga sp.]|jgi:hypothetical protein|uniref:hypothetical protein n=1 Tax=Roseivirga sp. TaxID=1964215 RepID=UPI001B2C8410|nr:hypothetical protein [Roseivirga sp.]MBO6496682.1 hypothetical protein [Roseivirga sp.]